MIVTMLTNAAGPDFVLESGKTYNLPAALAKQFIQGNQAGKLEQRPGQEQNAGIAMRYAVPAAPGAKITRLPVRPDPGDNPDVVEYDEEFDGEGTD